MLKTIVLSNRVSEEDVEKKPCVFLLGGFDGLHTGHASLMAKAKKYGLPVGAMTIDGGKDGKSLFTLCEREEIFKTAGADFLTPFRFEEIRALSDETFLCLLTTELNISVFVCGEDFRFGKDARGTIGRISACTGIPVVTGAIVLADEEKIGTTKIKRLLSAGEVQKVSALLGYPYFICGETIKERGVGKTIGFPTANVVYPDRKAELRQGVYATRTTFEGKTYKGVTNYGARPTFGNDVVRTETYLDGFEGDLYGKGLKIEFLRYLRAVKQFDSVNALKAQIENDVKRSREDD